MEAKEGLEVELLHQELDVGRRHRERPAHAQRRAEDGRGPCDLSHGDEAERACRLRLLDQADERVERWQVGTTRSPHALVDRQPRFPVLDDDVAWIDNDRPKLRERARRRDKAHFDVFGVLLAEGFCLLEGSDVRWREHGAVGHVGAGESVLDPRDHLPVCEALGLGELGEVLGADQIGLAGARLIVRV